MKFKKGIVFTKCGADYYLVDSGASGKRWNGMIKMNPTSAFLAERLKEGTTAEALADALCEKYDVEHEQALNDVNKIVAQFVQLGLIVED